MKTPIRSAVAVTVILLLLTAVDSRAKAWRGLTPTRSTQLDAARVAAECVNTSVRCTFRSEDSEVMIIYSGGNIGKGKCEQLPFGTVLAIKIRFVRLQQFEDFRLKNQKVVVFDSSTPANRDYKGYYYPEEGFIISAFKGQVYEVVYTARRKDLHRCPEYYDDPKGLVEIGIVY